ncbi:protein TolQ [delta proteobacterium NaphS2]|nr:protein TolQ [delta proteobacterium NaphS2]
MISIPTAGLIPAGVIFERALNGDIIQMIFHAGPMVKFVMLILFFFSITTWAIIFLKFRMLRKARDETDDFLELFYESRDIKKIYRSSDALKLSPVAQLFRAGYAEFTRFRKMQGSDPDGTSQGGTASQSEYPLRSQQTLMDNLERALRKAEIDQNKRLEKALSFLATTGNTAPFIGLFGTVWGIMESFHSIGLKGSANLAVVAPGISEALVATAAGLAAAIPAVVAFNYFTQRVVSLRAEMDIFATDFLSMVVRQFFKKPSIRKGTL